MGEEWGTGGGLHQGLKRCYFILVCRCVEIREIIMQTNKKREMALLLVLVNRNNMRTNRNELMSRLSSGITNEELENLVRMREDARRPIPAPRRNVQQYRPIPAPRIKKHLPVPAPRTIIIGKRKALNGFTKSYEIELRSNRDPSVQLQHTRLAIGRIFGSVLDDMRGFKFVETLKDTFGQRINDKNEYRPIYFNSKPNIILDSGDFMSNLILTLACLFRANSNSIN